ncbi:hypothetical protein C6497_02785 [Candidatus Poribacteria bacterium]|nr:MAG: hypothetical protein C6497_02785 [Candidatus Poribacteria bacterium]
MSIKNYIYILFILLPVTLLHADEISDPLFDSDVNADGIVNILDLVYVASKFGQDISAEQFPNPDVNKDGSVDILDLTLIAGYFGKYSGIPLQLTDVTFDDLLQNVKLPILVEFESKYCFYCFLMRPTIARIALEFRDVFHVGKLEVNENPLKTAEYHIRGTPTYILFYKGKVIERIEGAMPRARLLNKIHNALGTVVNEPLEQEQENSE